MQLTVSWGRSSGILYSNMVFLMEDFVFKYGISGKICYSVIKYGISGENICLRSQQTAFVTTTIRRNFCLNNNNNST